MEREAFVILGDRAQTRVASGMEGASAGFYGRRKGNIAEFASGSDALLFVVVVANPYGRVTTTLWKDEETG